MEKIGANASIYQIVLVNNKNTPYFAFAYSHKQLVLVAALVSTRAFFIDI